MAALSSTRLQAPLVAAAVKALDEGRTGALAALPRSSISAEQIAAAAREQDPLALELFEGAGRYLGIAAATIANLLNLEAIILSGGVAASFDLLIDSIRREIRGRAFAVPASRIEVVKGNWVMMRAFSVPLHWLRKLSIQYS